MATDGLDREDAAAPLWTHSRRYEGVAKSTVVHQGIKAILSAYRRDDYADPEGFVVQLGFVMEQYEVDVIGAVCHPITGIQRRCKFPPTIAEMAEALEAEAAQRSRLRVASTTGLIPMGNGRRYCPPISNEPGCFATIFVTPEAPQYERVMDWYKTDGKKDNRHWKGDARPGLWVSNIVLWNLFGDSQGWSTRQIGKAVR